MCHESNLPVFDLGSPEGKEDMRRRAAGVGARGGVLGRSTSSILTLFFSCHVRSTRYVGNDDVAI
jgi:hypothetical protein